VRRSRGQSAKDAHFGADDRSSDPRLRWYPPSWRSRYGDEFLALLDDEYDGKLPALVRLSLIPRGLQQRARQSGLTGDSAPAGDGLRAGALVVLAAWTAFVVAGASFSKFSEHFDESLPHGSAVHRVPDLAMTVIQIVAATTSVLVIAGALLAVPAFVRFLRSDGWASLRGHFLRALACTAFTGAATVPLLIWAHHLTAHQRNGGVHWYGILFFVWATFVAITLTLWTVVAVAAARRLDLPTTILTAEAMLAAAVAGAMFVMGGATVVWWAAMAKNAPAFLNASPGGSAGSSWDIWLNATVALMALAMGAAVFGVVREIRAWTRMRQGRAI
jgi:hypothetical protein